MRMAHRAAAGGRSTPRSREECVPTAAAHPLPPRRHLLVESAVAVSAVITAPRGRGLLALTPARFLRYYAGLRMWTSLQRTILH